MGLLLADYRHDYIRSVVTPLAAVNPDKILEHYAEMEQGARLLLRIATLSERLELAQPLIEAQTAAREFLSKFLEVAIANQSDGGP